MKNACCKALFVIAVASFLSAGCVVRTYPGPAVGVTGEVEVGGPPPPPVEETVTVSPDPAFVWIGGSWIWVGGGWRWEGGHWGRPPHPGAVWAPNRYVYRGGRHVFVHGGWR
jgi:hypothetical protein